MKEKNSKQLSGTNKSRDDMGMEALKRSFKMANVIVKTSKASIRRFFMRGLFSETRLCVLNINEAGREETNSNFSPTKASLLSHAIKSSGF